MQSLNGPCDDLAPTASMIHRKTANITCQAERNVTIEGKNRPKLSVNLKAMKKPSKLLISPDTLPQK
jgi:hypothetical protein